MNEQEQNNYLIGLLWLLLVQKPYLYKLEPHPPLETNLSQTTHPTYHISNFCSTSSLIILGLFLWDVSREAQNFLEQKMKPELKSEFVDWIVAR